MARNDYGDLIAKWKVDVIGMRARQFGFRNYDVPDLEQRIVPELLSVKFDPRRPSGAKEKTFVIAVIDRQLRWIKRDREREVRRANYETRSLDDPELTEEAFFAQQSSDAADLRVDIHSVLPRLTPLERRICEALSQGNSQADIARSTGRSKATISGEVKRLREKFRRWGLDVYVSTTRRGASLGQQGLPLEADLAAHPGEHRGWTVRPHQETGP